MSDDQISTLQAELVASKAQNEDMANRISRMWNGIVFLAVLFCVYIVATAVIGASHCK